MGRKTDTLAQGYYELLGESYFQKVTCREE